MEPLNGRIIIPELLSCIGHKMIATVEMINKVAVFTDEYKKGNFLRRPFSFFSDHLPEEKYDRERPEPINNGIPEQINIGIPSGISCSLPIKYRSQHKRPGKPTACIVMCRNQSFVCFIHSDIKFYKFSKEALGRKSRIRRLRIANKCCLKAIRHKNISWTRMI